MVKIGTPWGHISTPRDPKRPFWGPGSSEGLGGHQGPYLVPTVNDWSYWVGKINVMCPGTSMVLLGPQKGSYWPQEALLGAQKSFCLNMGMWAVQVGAKVGPDLTAPFWLIWNHPAGENSQKPIFVPVLAPEAPFGGIVCHWKAWVTQFGNKCQQLIHQDMLHPYHVLWGPNWVTQGFPRTYKAPKTGLRGQNRP